MSLFVPLRSLGHVIAVLGAFGCTAFVGATAALAQSDTCLLVSEPVSFCGESAQWQTFDDGDDDTDASYVGPEGILGLIYVDAQGTDDGQNLDLFLESQLENPPSANLDASVEVLANTIDTVDGYEGRSLVVGLKMDGRPASLMYTVVVGSSFTVRFATLAERGENFEAQARLHLSFISDMKIGGSDD